MAITNNSRKLNIAMSIYLKTSWFEILWYRNSKYGENVAILTDRVCNIVGPNKITLFLVTVYKSQEILVSDMKFTFVSIVTH